MVSGFFSSIDSLSITEILWRGLRYRVEWVNRSLLIKYWHFIYWNQLTDRGMAKSFSVKLIALIFENQRITIILILFDHYILNHWSLNLNICDRFWTVKYLKNWEGVTKSKSFLSFFKNFGSSKFFENAWPWRLMHWDEVTFK